MRWDSNPRRSPTEFTVRHLCPLGHASFILYIFYFILLFEGRIELPTYEFSAHRSTTELPELQKILN